MTEATKHQTPHYGQDWLREAAWGGAMLVTLSIAAIWGFGIALGGGVVLFLASAWATRILLRSARIEQRAQIDEIEHAALLEENNRLCEERDELERDARRLRYAARLLEVQRQEAETANLSKGAFLANMSHEIRTPMNGILGMGRLLSETDLTREQKDFTHTILDSAEALLVLLDDILDLSKIEAGKLELEDVDFDLHACLEKSVNLLLPKAAEKGLEVACELSPDVPQFVRGDSARLRQIVINLISNALKFTDAGEVSMRVGVQEAREGSFLLRVEVRDTGPGISSERRAAIFAPFTQEDSSTTRRFGGTGLGLAISRQLADTMGGEMGVDEGSSPDGSCFWFTAELRYPAESPDSAGRDWGALRGLRVLLVDDNATHRRIVRGYLERWEIECVDVADREDALTQIAESGKAGVPFDVALIDSDLEDGDGIELAQAVLQDPLLEPPNLVLLKTFRCQYKANRLTRIGFDAWVAKPVWPRVLREALLHLRDVAEQVEVRDALQRPAAPEEEKEAVEGSFELDVLLVEDNVVNQKVAKLLLKKLGCSIDVAANGLQAVEMARAKRYDLVFMDCQMPVMNGFDATRSIRAIETQEHLPIIAMTANAMEEDRQRCLEAGMDDYLSKPVNLDRLQSVMERWAGTACRTTPIETHTTMIDDQTQNVLDADVLESLRELSDGDNDLLVELVELFLEDTPPRLKGLQEALERGDAAGLESAAHALKSSCANIGALFMSELCREIEALGREQRVGEAVELVRRSTAEFVRVQSALASEIAS